MLILAILLLIIACASTDSPTEGVLFLVGSGLCFLMALVPSSHTKRKPTRSAKRHVMDANVDAMDGHNFECFCADLLKYDGFTNIEVTRASGDQGVDIIAYKDGFSYAFQCKRYSNNIGNKPVQEVNTGKIIYGCDYAVVLTNSYFTPGAKNAANAVDVYLWDRKKLDQLIQQKQNCLSRERRDNKKQQRQAK